MMANNQNFDLKISFSADLGNTGVVFRQVHQNIATSFGNLGSTITGTGAVAKKGLDELGNSAGNNAKKHTDANTQIGVSQQSLAEKIEEKINQMKAAYAQLAVAIAAVATAIAGAKWLDGLISKQGDANESVYKLSQSLNISLQSASVYKEALEDIGLESDVLIRASRLLGRQISNDSLAFKQYGISLKDNKGEFKSTDTIMQDVIKKFKELGNQTATNTFGGKVFSRSFNEVRGIVRLTAESLEHARQRAEEFGLILTQGQLEATRKYKVAQEDANDVMQEFSKQLAFRIIPIMSDFLKQLDDSREALKAFGLAIQMVLIVINLFFKALAAGWYVAELAYLSFMATLDRVAGAFANVTYLMLDTITRGAEEATAVFMAQEAKRISNSNANFTTYFSEFRRKTAQQVVDIQNMFAGLEKAEKIISGDEGGKPAPKFIDPREAEAQMKELMLQLAKEEADINAETIYSMEERNSRLISLYEKYIQQKITAIEFEGTLEKQASVTLNGKLTSLLESRGQKELALFESNRNALFEIKNREYAEEERQIERSYALGEITEQQKLDSLGQILSKREELTKMHYFALDVLATGDSLKQQAVEKETLAAYAELMKKRTMLAEINADRMKIINKKMATDFVNAFQSGFKGIISGTQSFTEGMRSIFNGLLDIFDEIIWGMVRQWILGEEAKTAASVFGFELIAGLTAAFYALMEALGWESVGKKVLQEETKGTATIWGEWGAYPPIAIALTAGLIGILAGLAFSAKGGWDSVPFDGAMTSLHKGEMVLPQNLAEKVRNMTETKPSQNITYNINAMDAQSFKSFASKNKSILFNTHNSALRDGLQYGVRGV